MIFAAEDHDVEVPVRFDAEIVVRTPRVPPQRVGHRTARRTSGDDVAGVQRELGLEEGRAGESGKADERIVRRQDDVLEAHRVAADRERARLVAEVLGGRVLEDPAPQRDERLRDPGEIPADVDAGLTGEPDAGEIEERHGFDVGRVEAELPGEPGILQEAFRLCFRVALRLVAGRSMEVAIDPFEAGVDAVLPHHVVDRRDRGQPGVPDGLRVVLPEPLDELAQAAVGHHREMRARVPRVDHRAATALEHDDPPAGLRQQVGRRETGHAGAHDDDVGFEILGELGERRKRGRSFPVRRRLELLRGHRDQTEHFAYQRRSAGFHGLRMGSGVILKKGLESSSCAPR